MISAVCYETQLDFEEYVIVFAPGCRIMQACAGKKNFFSSSTCNNMTWWIILWIVDWQKALSLISIRELCQTFSPLQTFDVLQVGFEPAQNLISEMKMCRDPLQKQHLTK